MWLTDHTLGGGDAVSDPQKCSLTEGCDSPPGVSACCLYLHVVPAMALVQCPSVACGPAAAPPPDTGYQYRICVPARPGPSSDSLGVEPRNLCFNQLQVPSVFHHSLRAEKHCWAHPLEQGFPGYRVADPSQNLLGLASGACSRYRFLGPASHQWIQSFWAGPGNLHLSSLPFQLRVMVGGVTRCLRAMEKSRTPHSPRGLSCA